MNIKRYNIVARNSWSPYSCDSHENGQFVIYKDHEKTVQHLTSDRDHWRDKYYLAKFGKTWTEMENKK